MLKKGYLLTDIHFGKKSNSSIHNQDCLDYLTWFCKQFKNDKSEGKYIAFLGDWHESRTSIDVSTLDYSYKGAKMLNDIGVPVYFIVGNHDLGTRDSRTLYSTIPFNEFSNFILVNDKPIVVDEIYGKSMFCPFLMQDEYDMLNDYSDIPVWFGHFEFNGFVLTGLTHKMEHGSDQNNFKSPNHILSGHYHRRQSIGNKHYIGNTFPMDFGDANLHERGLAIYDHVNSNLSYIDWLDCPKYIKCKLSDLLDDKVDLLDNSYVKVDVDIVVSYEEIKIIQDEYNKKYNLRTLHLDENLKYIDGSMEELDESFEIENKSTNELILGMLEEVDGNKFDTTLLIKLYKESLNG
jgi:DNA repair exonuclease SbcCD nuclease subunit